jgi:hypothetical protein
VHNRATPVPYELLGKLRSVKFPQFNSYPLVYPRLQRSQAVFGGLRGTGTHARTSNDEGSPRQKFPRYNRRN